MSVRRHVLLPSVAISTLAGLLQFNGFRVLHEVFGLGLDSTAFQFANVALQFGEFGVAVGLPVALGYWLGTRSDLREDYLALAVVVALAALVGYAASVGVTLLVANPERFRFPAAYAVAFLATNPLRFAVAVEAGAALGYFRAGHDSDAPRTRPT